MKSNRPIGGQEVAGSNPLNRSVFTFLTVFTLTLNLGATVHSPGAVESSRTTILSPLLREGEVPPEPSFPFGQNPALNKIWCQSSIKFDRLRSDPQLCERSPDPAQTNDRLKVSYDSLPFVTFLTFCSKIFSSVLLLFNAAKSGVTVCSSSFDFDHSS